MHYFSYCDIYRRTADLNGPEGSLAETEYEAMEYIPMYSAPSNEREREIQLEPNLAYPMHTANANNSPFCHWLVVWSTKHSWVQTIMHKHLLVLGQAIFAQFLPQCTEQ